MMGAGIVDVKRHYDLLIDEENDPVRDPDPLRAYMDRWDGQPFLEALGLTGREAVLEIGVGTGRLAQRVIPLCRHFTGIDLSPKTISRAEENLGHSEKTLLICGDFLDYASEKTFDVIYCSLTMMHFPDKMRFLRKVSSLLRNGGMFAVSLDKNREPWIDMGSWKIQIYPDDPAQTAAYIRAVGMTVTASWDTEAAWILICRKD